MSVFFGVWFDELSCRRRFLGVFSKVGGCREGLGVFFEVRSFCRFFVVGYG